MWKRIFIPPLKNIEDGSGYLSEAMNAFDAMTSYGDYPQVINGTYIHTYSDIII